MKQYDDTNRGALFKNARKEADTHADYNGSINVEGHDFWLNAWLKTSKDGKTFMSLSVKRKDGTSERPEQFVKKAQQVFPGAQLDDSDWIPF